MLNYAPGEYFCEVCKDHIPDITLNFWYLNHDATRINICHNCNYEIKNYYDTKNS